MTNTTQIVGGDVKTVTTDSEGSLQGTTIAMLAGGGTVVAWFVNSPDTSTYEVYSQAFDADGVAISDKTLVNTQTSGQQVLPQIIPDRDGNYSIAWIDQSDNTIRSQSFTADGAKVGDEVVLVHTDSTARQLSSGYFASGEPLLGWKDSTGFHAEVFYANGTTSSNVTTPDTADDSITHVRVTSLIGGQYLKTWQTSVHDSEGNVTGSQLRGQIYSVEGQSVGGVITINESSTENSNVVPHDVAALGGGGFAIVWGVGNQGQDGQKLQMYDYNGVLVEETTTIEPAFAGGTPSDLSVAALVGGNVVVVWAESNNGLELYSRIYNSHGAPVGDAVHVSAFDDSVTDANATVTALKNGGYTVSWESFGGAGTILHTRDFTPHETPTAVSTSISIAEDSSHTFTAADFAFTDADGDTLASVTIVELPPKGTLTLDGNAVNVDDVIKAADIGKLVWTPVAGDHGDYGALTFKVTDSAGGVSIESATVSLTVNNVNDAPTGADKSIQLNEDTSHTFAASEFGFSDSDGNDFQGIVVTTLPVNGTLKLDGKAVTVDQTITVADIGKLVWAPDANKNWQTDNFGKLGFKVVDTGGTDNDGHNTAQTENAITFFVADVNDAPSGKDTTVTILEDHSYTFSQADFSFTDVNDDDTTGTETRSLEAGKPAPSPLLGIIVTHTPDNGTLKIGIGNISDGIYIPAANIDKLVWTPAANANGKGLATLTFQVIDKGGKSSGGVNTDPTPNTITFNVTPVSDAPTGTNKTVTILEDKSYKFSQSDFGFKDIDGDAMTGVKISTLPANGSLTLNGHAVTKGQTIKTADIAKLVWTPAANDAGKALGTFTFQVADKYGIDATPNTFTIHVTEVTDKVTGTSKGEILKGTKFHDIIDAKAGNDTLTGGAGADTFIFKVGYGKDTIKDFDAKGRDHDTLDVGSISAITSFKDLKANHLSTHGSDVWVDAGHGDIVVLKGVKIADLDAADFLI